MVPSVHLPGPNDVGGEYRRPGDESLLDREAPGRDLRGRASIVINFGASPSDGP